MSVRRPIVKASQIHDLGTPSVTEAVPVALFAYSRPKHLMRTLECLRENEVPLIYAFSDGPKTPEMVGRVSEVRAVLRSVDWCRLVLTERPENLGLGRSIRTGVAEVFSKHDALIVFEDDLICVPGTYRYLCEALKHYADCPQVMSVTGWTHPRITPDDVKDQPYFDGRAESLVWGAWSRSWQGMDREAWSQVQECEQKGIDPYRYGADLVGQARGELKANIWACRFCFAHILRGGLCLRPPHSMVEHIGFDELATNSPDGSQWANPPLKSCPPIPGRWPQPSEHPECSVLWRTTCGEKPPERRPTAGETAHSYSSAKAFLKARMSDNQLATIRGIRSIPRRLFEWAKQTFRCQETDIPSSGGHGAGR